MVRGGERWEALGEDALRTSLAVTGEAAHPELPPHRRPLGGEVGKGAAVATARTSRGDAARRATGLGLAGPRDRHEVFTEFDAFDDHVRTRKDDDHRRSRGVAVRGG
jgi:hypothetical protein